MCIRDSPVTDSTITGSNENDDNTTEIGSYLQSDIKVNDQINLVGAGRIDKHSRLEDVIFSPRAAIVYNPIKDQSLRLTFNRAFSTPGTNELFLDIIAGKSAAFNIRATGIPKNGFTFEMFNGRPLMHSPFKANKNEAIPIDSINRLWPCLLYTSDAADERSSVDLGGRRIIKKKKKKEHRAGETSKIVDTARRHEHDHHLGHRHR